MNTRVSMINELSADTRDAMRVLLGCHFEGVSPQQFDRDLQDKTHAVLLYKDGGRLVGFSTFAFYHAIGPDGEPASIVCSGDTIVSPDAWGTSHLPSAWVQAVHTLHDLTDNQSLYWLLITSGFRTYRFLPVFVKSFIPRLHSPGDPAMLACMHRLARQRWGDAYRAEAGIVQLTQPQRLRNSLAGVPLTRQADRHVAFFIERNPGHEQGDELVSLASLDRSNLTRAGLRMLDAQSNPQHAPRTGARVR